MVNRDVYKDRVQTALARSPIVALLGPRQCGKTTLARQISQQHPAVYFDLESQPDIQRLQNPEMVLSSLGGLVIIDEIQTMPELFAALRVVCDKPANRCRFLILGSASPAIIKKTSETLAGRVEFVDMAGFDLKEVGGNLQQLWIRGGFPRSYLADSEQDSVAWREGFIRTFLQRDIPSLGLNISSVSLRKFWTMAAHYHGQIWNAARIASSMGMSDKTAKSWLDILTETYMIRQLQPWFENVGKRQVKSPKIYFRDSGLLHHLLSLQDYHAVIGHPQAGASWEGFAMEQILLAVRPAQAYFWSAHSSAEIDLFFIINGKRYGFEFKLSEAPEITRSMKVAIETLKLDRLIVVYPGLTDYPVDEKIYVCSIQKATEQID